MDGHEDAGLIIRDLQPACLDISRSTACSGDREKRFYGVRIFLTAPPPIRSTASIIVGS